MIPKQLLELDISTQELYSCMLQVLPLPSDIVEIIVKFLLINKIKVIIKENNYKPYILSSDDEYIKFYIYILRFAKEYNMTSNEFDEWFLSGLHIGFTYDSYNRVLWRLPNGKSKIMSEVSCIINCFDYRDNIIDWQSNIINLQIKKPRLYPIYYYEPVMDFISII